MARENDMEALKEFRKLQQNKLFEQRQVGTTRM